MHIDKHLLFDANSTRLPPSRKPVVNGSIGPLNRPCIHQLKPKNHPITRSEDAKLHDHCTQIHKGDIYVVS